MENKKLRVIECKDTCKQCGCKYDKNEVKRINGSESAVFYMGFCSARCFTEDRMQNFNK